MKYFVFVIAIFVTGYYFSQKYFTILRNKCNSLRNYTFVYNNSILESTEDSIIIVDENLSLDESININFYLKDSLVSYYNNSGTRIQSNKYYKKFWSRLKENNKAFVVGTRDIHNFHRAFTTLEYFTKESDSIPATYHIYKELIYDYLHDEIQGIEKNEINFLCTQLINDNDALQAVFYNPKLVLLLLKSIHFSNNVNDKEIKQEFTNSLDRYLSELKYARYIIKRR